MKIVNAVRADTGGHAIRLSHAINSLYKGEHTSRAFTSGLNYGRIPFDILYKNEWKGNHFPDEVIDIWEAADIYHLHNSRYWVRKWPLSRINPKSGVIMQSHGRPPLVVNEDVLAERQKVEKFVRVVSTPGLLYRIFGYDRYYAENKADHWFPIPINISAMKRLRRHKRKKDGIIRVVHAPTVNKNTKEFLEVMKLIEQKYKNVQTIVIRKQTQVNAINLKAVGAIHFNALRHGMGSNVFECMAMGIPSITGNWDPRYPNLIKELHPDHVLPYINVTKKEDLFEAIERLIVDESLRRELAIAGMVWVEKYHTFKYTAELAIKTYKEAIALRS